MPTSGNSFDALVGADPQAAAKLMNELRKTMFVPHEGGQAQVMRSSARFRVLRAGRRWGKTQLAAHETVMAAISKPNQMVWWIGNTDTNVRRGYRTIIKQIPRSLLDREPPSENANQRMLSFKNGSRIEFYTAGSPEALAGEGVNFVVVDEAALIPEAVWFQLIRPTLADTGGRALIISTPRGRNWFWRVWNRGQESSLYESWHFKTLDSPYIDKEEVDDARDSLPDLLYQQEFEAEFVQNAASIFNMSRPGSIREGLVAPTGWVTLGVDLAKKEDFTVLSGCNSESREPCFLERLNEVSWAVQQTFIVDTVRDLEQTEGVEGVTVVVDSTGVGEVVHDNLDDLGLDVVPINFASGNIKERMVRLLAADIEHGRAFITEAERREFEAYEYEIAPSGRYKFEAADGHDDYVAAKMLQNWGVVHEAPPGVSIFDPAEVNEEEAAREAVTSEVIVADTASEIMANPDAWV
jgi:hypothetical protein